jgi:hypothetical protein
VALQNYWVGGGERTGPQGAPPSQRTAVTDASGQKTEGRLVRLDDFSVVVALADGSVAFVSADGDVPKVEVRDPQGHRKLLPLYADKDIRAMLIW